MDDKNTIDLASSNDEERPARFTWNTDDVQIISKSESDKIVEAQKRRVAASKPPSE